MSYGSAAISLGTEPQEDGPKRHSPLIALLVSEAKCT